MTPAPRLVGTLTAAGALAGLLLAFVYGATLPSIEAHRRETLEAALREVLRDPARWEVLVRDGSLLRAPARDDEAGERVWRAFDDAGRVTGYAMLAEGAGFQDVVRLLVGWDPREDRLLGVKVLEQRETPGLGDKIEDATFLGAFEGRRPPVRGVRGGATPPSDVDTITGATISSRTVIRLVNEAVARWRPAIEAAEAGP